MSDLLLYIQEIKNKLASLDLREIEEEANTQKNRIINRKSVLENKLDNLLLKSEIDNRIYIDACGTVFTTTKDTILDCQFSNILQDKLSTTQGSYDNPLFVNIPKKYFKLVLNILRRFSKDEQDNIAIFNQKYDKFNVILNSSKVSIENLEIYIRGFFKASEIFDKLKIMNKVKPIFVQQDTKNKKNRER